RGPRRCPPGGGGEGGLLTGGRGAIRHPPAPRRGLSPRRLGPPRAHGPGGRRHVGEALERHHDGRGHEPRPHRARRPAARQPRGVLHHHHPDPLAGEAPRRAHKEAFAAVGAQRLPPEYGILLTGRGKLLQEALGNFAVAFVLSLCFIYIVLAAQFESFVHPLTIMVSMFLSIPFGILTLKLLDRTLNIYSIMGLFLLMGVVKKNAILQVDYTNVLRERGMERTQAQMEADRARLRPILMTTLAIVAGMLPVAMGRGDGSASRASLATVVVGGQLL